MDKLNLEIGWDIDNNQLKAGLDQARKNIEGVGQTIEIVEDKVNSGFQSSSQQVSLLAKNYEQLRKEAEEYAKVVATSFDPTEIAAYNAKLAAVREEMAKIKAMGLDIPAPKVPAQKWNSLQNSINQISREMPAFTYSIQTGFMAISNNLPMLFDDIGRIRNENQALLASGQKGVPLWKQLTTSLFSWNTAMSVGITLLTVFGKEIGEWVVQLFAGKKGLDALKAAKEALNKAMDDNSYSKAIMDVERLRNAVDMAKGGFVEKKKVVEEYNKTIGRTTGEVKTLDQVERFLIANANNYVKMMMYKAAANIALADAAKEAVEAEKTRMKELKEFEKTMDKQIPVGIGTSGYVSQTDIKNAQYNAKKLAEARKDEQLKIHEDAEKKQLDISNNFMRKAQEYASKMGISVFGDDPKKEKDTTDRMENLFVQIANGRKEMWEKVLALDKEYARKSMESDAAEVQALKDKFAEFRRIIIKENEKIQRYNDKNKNKKGFQAVDLIDVSAVDPIEARANQQLTYNQGTAKTAKEIEQMKKVFADYEDYRSKLGKEKADERYKSEMGGFEKYIDYIKALEAQEGDAFKAVGDGSGTAQQEERVKIIKKEKEEAVATERKKQVEVLAMMVTYDQQRKNLINKYETERASIVKTSSDSELAEFDRRHNEELKQLDDENINRLQSVKHLFDGIERLTDAQARKVIKDIQELLASGVNISPEMLKKLKDALKDTTKALDARLPDRIMQMSGAFNQMGQEISGVNEGLGNMLTAVGSILASSVQIGESITAMNKGLDNYKSYKDTKEKSGSSAAGGLLGGISAVAGVAGPIGSMVGAVAGVASGVIKFFGAAKESARQAAKQMKEYQESVLTGEYEYNRILRERAREHEDINQLTLEQIGLQQKLLTLQTTQATNDYNSILKRIQSEGEQITGQKTEKYGGFLGVGKKTRVVDITAGLSGYTYEQLEKLYTSNKLTEATKKLFEELKKNKEEIDSIGDAWDDMEKQLLDKMSGGATSDSIASSIISGIKEGKRAFEDFGDDINSIVENALLSAMSATVLEEPLQELVKKFREDSKDGLDQSEIDAFKKGYGDIVKEGLDALKIIEGTYGTIKGDANSSVKSEGIDRVSEQTASEFTGISRAHLDVSKQNLDISKQHLLNVQKVLEFEAKSYEAMQEQVRVLKLIEGHTRGTVEQLVQAVDHLKAIKDNTKGGYYAG